MTLSAVSFGQSLQLADSSGVLANGAEITILRNPMASSEIPCVLFVKNLTNGDLEVNCARTNLSVIPNTENYFCWGACYPPFVDTGSVYVNIQRGKWDSTFIAHYSYENPTGVFNKGTSRIQYTFYEASNISNSVSVIVNFVCGYTGIEEYSMSKILSAPYPNPVTTTAKFDYILPPSVTSASISIRNLLGTEMRNVKLEQASGKAIVNTSGLPAGLYVYYLVLNNKVTSSRKLVINR